MQKECQSCNNVFYKKQNESVKYWETKKYCSKECSLKFTSVQRQENFGKHPDNFIPWNKGLNVRLSPKSEFKKGHIPWIKGKEGLKRENNPMWKGRKKKNCIICNNEFEVAPWLERKRFCSHLCYMKWRRGKNNPRYKGDKAIVKLRKRLIELAEYSEWHRTVMKRDNYLCQECKERGEDVHHLKSVMVIFSENRITTIEQARKCLELWDIANGQTLCRKCHRKTDTYGKQVNPR